MQLEFGIFTINLLPLIVTVGLIAMIYLLSKWSQELEEKRYTFSCISLSPP